MRARITYWITEGLQKKLAMENKNAENRQSVEVEINNQKLIEKLSIDYKGRVYYDIPEKNYYYVKKDDEIIWTAIENYFNFELTEKELIAYFSVAEMMKVHSDGLETQKNYKEKLEKEKKEQESFQQEAQAKKEKDIIESEINTFLEKSGSETAKLRKKLGYEYENLIINEMLDEIESEYTIDQWIIIDDLFDERDYNWKKIDKPSLELLKIEERLQDKELIDRIEFFYVSNEEENAELMQVTYSICCQFKTRYYKIS